MALKVPYQLVRGLDREPQQQLYRNFEEIQRAFRSAAPGTSDDGSVTFGVARIGTSGAHGTSFAEFSHVSMWSGGPGSSTTYGVLQGADGHLYLNTSITQGGHLRHNNVNIAGWDQGSFYMEGNLPVYWLAHGGGWHMSDTSWMRVTGDKGVYSGGEFRSNAASMKSWPSDGNYAQFSHNSRGAGEGYGFLQHSNGTVYISSTSDFTVNAGGSAFARFIVSNADPIIRFRGSDNFGGGDCARIHADGEAWFSSVGIGGDNPHNSGMMVHNNWIRMKANYGIYWEDVGNGWYGAIDGGRALNLNHAGCITEMFRSGGGVTWNSAPCVVASDGGNIVGYNFHHRGIRNAMVWLGGDGRLNMTGDGYGCIINGDFNDTSSIRGKRNVRSLERDKSKIHQLRPVRFQRVMPQEERDRREREIAEGRWTDERWNAWVREQDDREWVGFIAEEVREVIPEAATPNVDGEITGIRYGPIIAHLVSALQELDERLDALEAENAALKSRLAPPSQDSTP